MESTHSIHLEQQCGNYAIVTCKFKDIEDIYQLEQLIRLKFPEKCINYLLSTKNKIIDESNFTELKCDYENNNQIIVEFNESMLQDYNSVEQPLDGSFIIGPVVKKILNHLNILLPKERFASVNEFVTALPDGKFKSVLFGLKQGTNGVSQAKIRGMLKRIKVSENEFENEISYILQNLTISKPCGNCKKPLDGTKYQCLFCENYLICHKCEELNQHKPFHAHSFTKLQNVNNSHLHFNDIMKMRKFNQITKKLSGKPDRNKTSKALDAAIKLLLEDETVREVFLTCNKTVFY